MTKAYTVLWTKFYYELLRKAGDEGKPLTVLFGGIHQSAPSLAHAGIDTGDVVFPLVVYKQTIHVIAGAVVREFIDLDDYILKHLRLKLEDRRGWHGFGGAGWPPNATIPLGHRQPYGCGTEVALVERSTPARFDVTVPPDKLASIAFCPRKGQPIALRHVEDGRLTKSISLQGSARRLCPGSANLFCDLVGLEHVSG